MNETTEGTGKYSNANLLDNNKVELQTEYATIAKSFSEYDALSPLATIPTSNVFLGRELSVCHHTFEIPGLGIGALELECGRRALVVLAATRRQRRRRKKQEL
jgi:hypothetical protein